MTSYVSDGTLNLMHSLTDSLIKTYTTLLEPPYCSFLHGIT